MTQLLPPRFIPFHTRRLRSLPAIYTLAWPLFYMMTWYFRVIVYFGNLRDFRQRPDRIAPEGCAD
jgi:hypothetical protein